MKKLAFGIVLMSPLLLSGCGTIAIWRANYQGEAKLAYARSERQVQIEDAKGKLEAAKLKASAEVERAKGVAKANKIIGDSLKNNESYLRYLWIQNMNNTKSEVIYIPTEAGMPILESGKRGSQNGN